MRKMLQIASGALLVMVVGGGGPAPPAADPPLIGRIRQHLPKGWQCVVVKEAGKMGHPHGLREPVFRADFSRPDQTFDAFRGPQKKSLNPGVQLYFYAIGSKADVMKVIDRERIYSWNIPIYFGETQEYLVVTSPPYVNHGVFTEEAKKAIRPMWAVLRQHIENKEDKTVDQLAAPGSDG